MRASRAVALVLLCLSSFAGAHSDSSKSEYSCHYFSADGEVENRGYAISIWFDASITATQFTRGKPNESIHCDLDIFDFSPDKLIFHCKVNQEPLTITINKITLEAHATISGKMHDMICEKKVKS